MEFDQAADAQASATTPQHCSSLKVGGHVMIQGHPCKIANMLVSKPGKHGSTKVHLVAFDVYTGKRYEDVCPSSKMVMVPVLKKVEHYVSNVDGDGNLVVLTEKGEIGGSYAVAPVVQDRFPQPYAIMEQAFASNKDLLAQVLEFDGKGMVMELRSKAP